MKLHTVFATVTLLTGFIHTDGYTVDDAATWGGTGMGIAAAKANDPTTADAIFGRSVGWPGRVYGNTLPENYRGALYDKNKQLRWFSSLAQAQAFTEWWKFPAIGLNLETEADVHDTNGNVIANDTIRTFGQLATAHGKDSSVMVNAGMYGSTDPVTQAGLLNQYHVTDAIARWCSMGGVMWEGRETNTTLYEDLNNRTIRQMRDAAAANNRTIIVLAELSTLPNRTTPPPRDKLLAAYNAVRDSVDGFYFGIYSRQANLATDPGLTEFSSFMASTL